MRRGRSEEEPLIPREKPSARCFTSAIGNTPRIRAVDAHDVLLIARMSVARALQCQPFTIMTEIRFRVFAAECDLSNRCEVSLSRYGIDSLGRTMSLRRAC